MCIRRFVLYRCGHEGRQLGYSYCQFQEALDRLGSQPISEEHPIIKRHQRCCRKISGRQGEKRNRDCGECSRAQKSNDKLGQIEPGGQVSEAEGAGENISCLFHEDEKSEAGLDCLPLSDEQGIRDWEVDTDDEGTVCDFSGEEESERRRYHLLLSGGGFLEEPAILPLPSGEGPEAETKPPSPDAGEQIILSPSYKSSNNETRQLLGLLSTDLEPIKLTHKSSDSNCSTCSDPSPGEECWSPGSEVWNEDYQGERARTEIFERPSSGGCRVVNVGAVGPVGVGDRGGEEEDGKGEEDGTEEIETVDVIIEEQGERDFLGRSSSPILIPQLRRKRKSFALREEV